MLETKNRHTTGRFQQPIAIAHNFTLHSVVKHNAITDTVNITYSTFSQHVYPCYGLLVDRW